MRDEAVADNGRRDLIKKGAVAGAIVWVAPAIVSVQAASAATQPTLVSLGQSGTEGIHDTWLAIMVIDFNTKFTSAKSTPRTVTPDQFTFTLGDAPAVTGLEIQPFVVLDDELGDVVAIGTTRTGPYTPGETVTVPWGGPAFTLPANGTFRIGVRTVGLTDGTPIAYVVAGSEAVLSGGDLTTDSGSISLNVPPVAGTSGWVSYGPRSYQFSATFIAD